MGLDQRIWAAIKVNGVTKQVAIYYWRKNHEIDEWFFSRLPEAYRQEVDAENLPGWCCDVTPVELDLLEADDCALAFQIGFDDAELIWRCRQALDAGFTLTYCRDN